MHPLAVPSHLRPQFSSNLGHYGHARSQGERQPAAAKPPLYCIHLYWYTVASGARILNYYLLQRITIPNAC